MSGARGSFSHVNFHVSEDGRTLCHTYPDNTPILVVDAGSASLTITIEGRHADKTAVGFARALARDAQVFAAEVERLHTARHGDGKAGSSSAA